MKYYKAILKRMGPGKIERVLYGFNICYKDEECIKVRGYLVDMSCAYKEQHIPLSEEEMNNVWNFCEEKVGKEEEVIRDKILLELLKE